ILAVDGVDGIFIGPADLSASLGHPGEPGHPRIVGEVEQAIARVRAAGKAPGVLTTDEALARRYMAAGSLYTAVGVDAAILARHCDQLPRRSRGNAPRRPGTGRPALAGGGMRARGRDRPSTPLLYII